MKPLLSLFTKLLIIGFLLYSLSGCKQASEDFEARIARQVDSLVGQMTLEEKVSQMMNDAPAIPRLDVSKYNWWNECLHGVARADTATVFPQAIGLGATWDTELIHEMATVISDEARAKYHEAIRNGKHEQYFGLTFWSPNINIFADPRWGRGQETYGEDPYLTGKIGTAFVKGLQGDHPKYLKVVATPKHYAVHNGPEPLRHEFNAVTNKQDLHETYLPAFEMTVEDGGAYSVMGAYNAYNGIPCCAHPLLLDTLLRGEWDFPGYVVSDCGAIHDIHTGHEYKETPAEAAAVAVKRGTDLNCGGTYSHLTEAVEQGLISEKEINKSVKRLFKARGLLGMFDSKEEVPYKNIPYSVVDSREHRKLSIDVAQKSLVLLKNNHKTLPLDKERIETIAVVGPNADNKEILLGNYHGTPSKFVTPLQGIKNKVSENTEVLSSAGTGIVEPLEDNSAEQAVEYARKSDVVVMCGGISPEFEGEERGMSIEGFEGGDRTRIQLPEVQRNLLKKLYGTGTPVVLVLFNGGPVSTNWASDNLPAILEAWYPGQEGGTAVADALFGDYNPGGRLPVTIYKSVEDLPAFENYDMNNITYKFFKGEPLYPFGYGMSYTTFEYSDLEMPKNISQKESFELSIAVKNTGDMEGDEVVQVYVKDKEASMKVPIRKMQAFKRIHLESGESQKVNFTITPQQMAMVDEDGNWVIEPGEMEVSVGGQQPGFSGRTHAQTTEVLSGKITVEGDQKVTVEH